MKNQTTWAARLAAMLLSAMILLCGVNLRAAAGEAEGDALLHEQYDAAQALYDAGEYLKAAEAFEALGDFSNSRARAADSKRKWKTESYKEAISLFKEEHYYEARDLFNALGRYEDSASYLYKCNMKILRMEYQQAKEMFDAGDYAGAQALYESFGTYHDSQERAQEAADIIAAQKQAELELRFYEKAVAFKDAGKLEEARDAFIEAGDCKDATDQVYELFDALTKRNAYTKAQAYFADGDYENALGLFEALVGYEDCEERSALCKEQLLSAIGEQADAASANEPGKAYILYLFLGDYQDSKEKASALLAGFSEQNVYDAADALAQIGDFGYAAIGFGAIPSFADSAERAALADDAYQKELEYRRATCLKTVGSTDEANVIWEALGDYRDASLMITPDVPKFTAKQLRDYRTSAKSAVFTAPDGTKHCYQIYKGVPTWVQAKAFCEVLGGHFATLTTDEENAFVYNFMRESGYLTAYFGLSDEKRVGNWVWVTGEPFEYSNWHRGQPSRSARERYGMYLYMHTDGTWNDSHFYEHVEYPGCSYICEWDLTE